MDLGLRALRLRDLRGRTAQKVLVARSCKSGDDHNQIQGHMIDRLSGWICWLGSCFHASRLSEFGFVRILHISNPRFAGLCWRKVVTTGLRLQVAEYGTAHRQTLHIAFGTIPKATLQHRISFTSPFGITMMMMMMMPMPPTIVMIVMTRVTVIPAKMGSLLQYDSKH